MPTGIFACPNPQEMCVLAGGYAYIVDTTHPKHCTHIAMKPVVNVCPVVPQGVLLFIGFHSILALGASGIAWETERLSWEGVRITSIEENTLHGMGWNLLTDREVAFEVDLLTGRHQGGGFTPPQQQQKS